MRSEAITEKKEGKKADWREEESAESEKARRRIEFVNM